MTFETGLLEVLASQLRGDCTQEEFARSTPRGLEPSGLRLVHRGV